MKTLVLVVGLLLIGSRAQVASCLDISGTVYDPIQSVLGGKFSYSGPNLGPNANLTNANLFCVDLPDANLYRVDLYLAEYVDNTIGSP